MNKPIEFPNIALYDRMKYGHFGQFGDGANIRAFFLQSVIETSKLNEIHLINQIPGSERWSIRDLFQRDVDINRVDEEIKPHFENSQKVKFFSPLTLTLLPMENGVVSEKMPRATETDEFIDGMNWSCLTRGEHYRFRYQPDRPEWSILEWNSSNTRLVAIDGQHRLATMRSILEDSVNRRVSDFEEWRIPIIIASFKAATEEDKVPTVLEVIRQLFTNINTEAKSVTRSRQILLNDTRPNDICTQELVQRSHENDLLELDLRNEKIMPLLGFDWRSTSEDEYADVSQQYSTKGFKSVVELHDWIEKFVLDNDGDKEQILIFERYFDFKESLLEELQLHKHIPLHRTDEFRNVINEDFIEGVGTVLDHFLPYKNYIQAIREYERSVTDVQGSQNENVTTIYRHAFDEIRYGRNYDIHVSREQVEAKVHLIEEKIVELKRDHIPHLFDRAIGLRGVMAAFGFLVDGFAQKEDEKPNFFWRHCGQTFVSLVNQIYEDGRLDIEKNSVGRKLLNHCAVDHDDVIVNFKLKDVHRGLGNYLQMMVVAYDNERNSHYSGFAEDQDWWSDRLDDYRSVIFRGFKKEIRPFIVNEQFRDAPKKVQNEQINERAEKGTSLQLEAFRSELLAISPSLEAII